MNALNDWTRPGPPEQGFFQYVQYIVAVVFLLIAFVLNRLLPDELSSLSALFDLNSEQNLGIRLSIVVAGLLAAYNLVKAPINNDRVWRHYRLEKFGTNRRVQPAIEGANNWALQCPRPECGKTTHLIQYDCHQALYRCDGCGEKVAVRRKNFIIAKQPPQRQRQSGGATVWKSVRDMQNAGMNEDEVVTISGPLRLPKRGSPDEFL
jgi:hypothetical protein